MPAASSWGESLGACNLVQATSVKQTIRPLTTLKPAEVHLACGLTEDLKPAEVHLAQNLKPAEVHLACDLKPAEVHLARDLKPAEVHLTRDLKPAEVHLALASDLSARLKPVGVHLASAPDLAAHLKPVGVHLALAPDLSARLKPVGVHLALAPDLSAHLKLVGVHLALAPDLSAHLKSVEVHLALAPDLAAHLLLAALQHLQAVLAAEDASSVPMDVLAGIHKCLDKPTREVFQKMLQHRFLHLPDRGGKLQKRSSRAATRLLLWELRRAFCERRTPDLALAAHLLESGARTRPREEDTSDEDEEPEGHPGGARYATDYDDAPRNSLDLLALNRFADPQKLQVAIKKACEYKADPKQYSSYERPLALAVRSRNVAAVHALLDVGAPVDRQALSALQLISDRGCRQVIEDRFLTVVSSGNCSLCMKDVALWVLVQSGNVKALRRRLKSEQSDVTLDATVMMGLRRCRKSLCTQELRELLVERFGASSVSSSEAQAATAELVIELREALIDQRGPDEETVSELVNLGANVQAKNVDLDSYVEDEEETDDDAIDQESGSESED
eukprot:s1349_g13.t1